MAGGWLLLSPDAQRQPPTLRGREGDAAPLVPDKDVPPPTSIPHLRAPPTSARRCSAYLPNTFLSEPVWLACVRWPCAALCALLGRSAAYMDCASRGSCWKDENACGDAGPVGKKLAIGEDGGDV